ncbi:hypothetical protein QBC39DRAFT_371079 [Podospora conica]|nr:hypothetical protein QBC39DRAFT_371079 [Schizothecium conicum]
MASVEEHGQAPDDISTPGESNGAKHSKPEPEHGGNEDHIEFPMRKPRPGFLSRCITKLGLDVPTVLMMFKGSLPPMLGIVMYQSPAVSNFYTTLGYLIPIISVLALAILPRGKFLMNLFFTSLAICFGAALAMLALWTAVQARINTTPPDTPPARYRYNSSQSAVCGVWLFFTTWLGNFARAKAPTLNLPIIAYSILVNVACTYGPFLQTDTQVKAFVKKLLITMLTGLTLSLGVNILFFPVSSRMVVFKELAGAIGLLRKTVSLQKAYLVRLESDDMFAVVSRTATSPLLQDGKDGTPRLTKEAKAAMALKQVTDQLGELAGKLNADIVFAKRDIAWGHLDATDVSEMATLFRNVYIPVSGMSTIMDIFKRISERRGWDVEDDEDVDEVIALEREREKRVWNEVIKQIHEPFEALSAAIDQGLVHAGYCLGILPRLKAAAKKGVDADVEAQGEEIQPGQPGFAAVIDKRVAEFAKQKGELLRIWTRERTLIADEERQDGLSDEYSAERREREQSQLYIVLYMENLMHSSGQAVQDLVAFADRKVADGTMSKKRLIMPTLRRLRTWLVTSLSNSDATAESTPELLDSGANIVFLGDGYGHKKDPEHLPPTNAWQRFGTRIRAFSSLLSSEESAFGLRAACATMTIAVIAYLERTQVFFQEQRLVWALIMVAIGMTMTSGQSFFGFICRIGGTVIAMIFSYIIWYIVDGRKPGVIVFLWLFTFLDLYFMLKFPRFIPAVIIVIITQILIIGYELQVLTIGLERAEQTGQRFYAVYLLAPYRLACVAGGSAVAFFWTIFPKPMTDRTWLRRDLSATLYLVANYFGVINSTLHASLGDAGGHFDEPHSPAHHLYKVGRRIFGKVMTLVPSMVSHAEWQRYEPTVGGPFPRRAYDDIILRSVRIMRYLTLVSYTLTHPPRPATATATEADEDDRAWRASLASVYDALQPTHHAILSTLAQLSSSLLSGHSLPPFMPLPRPYDLTRRLVWQKSPDSPSPAAPEGDVHLVDSATGREDPPAPRTGILDPRNMHQRGYAEFSVLQVCTTLVCDDLEGLVREVSGLVGVVDFGFRFGGADATTLGSSRAASMMGGEEETRKKGRMGSFGWGEGRRGKGKGKVE